MQKDPQLNLEPTGETLSENITTAITDKSLDIGIAGAHPAAAITAKTSAVTKELNLDSYAEERVAACIATFIDGQAAGWFFAVSDAFKDSLDIQPTQRVFNGKPHTVMTQGKNFSFSRGDVIHGRTVNLCVQVKDAIVAKPAKTKDYETADGVQIFEDKSKQDADKKPKKDLYKIKFSRFQTDFGFVRFDLFHTDEGRYILIDTYETDQELFVRFLQTGLLRCNDGTEHDLNFPPGVMVTRPSN